MIVNNPVLTDSMIDSDGNLWRRKRVSLGAWDMTGVINKSVAHGIGSPAWKTIIVEGICIYDDPGTSAYQNPSFSDNADPDLIGVSVKLVNSTNIIISRRTGSIFDNILFDDGVMIRGYVTFWYIE